MLKRSELFQQLSGLEIDYHLYEHPPIFKAADVACFPQEVKNSLEGSIETKNLFLRDEKHLNFVLICVKAETRVRMKELGRQLGLKGLTFGSAEQLYDLLGITPGSVCLFSLANDKHFRVRGYIDESIAQTAHIQNHPLDNSATVVLSVAAISQFCRLHDHELTPVFIPCQS